MPLSPLPSPTPYGLGSANANVPVGTNAWKLKLPQEEWGFYYTSLDPGANAFAPVRNINKTPSEGFSLAADDKGNVTACWLSGKLYANVSHDGGKTFGKPVRVSPPDVREAWGPAIDIDDKGRLGLAYMASTNSPGAPWKGNYREVTFTGYLARIDKPTATRPKVVTVPVTPADAPLALGACGPGRCNNGILDFIDVALAPDGSVWGAFVDTSNSKHELVMGHLPA